MDHGKALDGSHMCALLLLRRLLGRLKADLNLK